MPAQTKRRSEMISTNVETITPGIAKAYLEFNTNNRSVNTRHIDYLAEAMRNQEWELNGVPIIFSEEGRLIDGQHRLQAIIKSGVSISALVTRGVKDKSFDTIDMGMKRTIGQVLTMSGVKNANNVAASLKLIKIWKTTGKFSRSGATISARETERELELMPEIVDSVAILQNDKVIKKLIPLTYSAVFHFILSKYNRDVCDNFFETLSTGFTSHSRYNVVVKLRDWLIINSGARGVTVDLKIMYFCKAIKHVVNESQPQMLKVFLGGNNAAVNPYDIGIGQEILKTHKLEG
jgi:hypothetical protein